MTLDLAFLGAHIADIEKPSVLTQICHHWKNALPRNNLSACQASGPESIQGPGRITQALGK